MAALGDYVFVYWYIGTQYGDAGKVTGQEYTPQVKSLLDNGYGVETTKPAGGGTPPIDPNKAVGALQLNTALKNINRTRALNDYLYMPTPTALLKWRSRANDAARGGPQAHFAALGDSITYGAAATGASIPKWRNSWPGRVRRHVDSLLGPGGTGMVPMNLTVTASPTYDPRLVLTGTVNRHNFGLFADTCIRLTAGATLSFSADNVDEFVIFAFSAGSNLVLNQVQIDGAAAKTFRNTSATSGADLIQVPGKWPNHMEIHVPAGAVGTHTMKITRPASGTDSDLFIWAVEGRNTSLGRIRVSNLGYSGKALASFAPSDETNGMFGLPMLDTIRPDLLAVGLGINDWQAQGGPLSIENVRTRLKAIVQRQRSTGSTPGGIAHPGGDAILVWFPQPDTATLAVPPNLNPSWQEIRETFYTVADEENVALLDLGLAWDGFNNGNSLGMFADKIHPNDKGGADIAEFIISATLPSARP